MSGSSILKLLLFLLAPALAWAQVGSSLYLLRMEHTKFESHDCVLLRKTGFFHLEFDSGESTKVFEGTLNANRIRQIHSDLQERGFQTLSQEKIEEPLIRRPEFLRLEVSRDDHWQELIFRSAESQEPYRRSLQPLVRWLDDLHKAPHKELSEDAGKNNCLPPGKIALKKRSGEVSSETAPTAGKNFPPADSSNRQPKSEAVPTLLQVSSLTVKSHAVRQTCVLIIANGFYRAEEEEQKQGSKRMETKITGGRFAPDEISQLQ